MSKQWQPSLDVRERVERKCRNCEYFDGGGLGPDDQPRNHDGDCLNGQSGRLQTTADETCHRFFVDTGRWPLRPSIRRLA
jgi:hypothetical protein